MTRIHTDRCPGVLRPWLAADGAIVRLRLVGGTLPATSLPALMDIAEEHADGSVLLTKRTQLQLRGIAHEDGCVSPRLVDALTDADFLPSPSHELVRNVMVSPLTGRVGGQADLRGLALDLDRRICAEPELARLAGRFLFVLDDGRGDIGERTQDLGVCAVDPAHVQIRIGSHRWGPVVAIDEAADVLVGLAMRFLDLAGTGGTELWHVDELPRGGAELLHEHHLRDVRTRVRSLPLPHGVIAQDDHREAEHLAVPDGLLTRGLVEALTGHWAREVVVTPWHSILLPDLEVY